MYQGDVFNSSCFGAGSSCFAMYARLSSNIRAADREKMREFAEQLQDFYRAGRMPTLT